MNVEEKFRKLTVLKMKFMEEGSFDVELHSHFEVTDIKNVV